MIYVLEMPYNQGLYVQWTDMLQSTGLDFTKLISHPIVQGQEVSYRWDDYLSHKINRDYIKSKISKDDTLLIDSHFIHPTNEHTHDRLELIDSEFDCKQIIIFHPDTGFNSNDRYGFNDTKIKIFAPTYNKNWGIDERKNSYNFYLCNGAYQGMRWMNEMVSTTYKDMLRYKKFISHNGVFKGHRSFLYNTLKQNDLLKDTFFSYSAYNIFDDNITTEESLMHDTSYDNHIQELLDGSNISEVEKYYSRDRHDKIYKKELPVILDYIPNLSNVDQYSFTLPYTSNSYIEIIGCTNLSSHGEELYTSEKIFKSFMSFQIPLFIGQPGLVELLRTLGFKMFDNVIDNSYDNIENNLERTNAVCEEIKRLGSMSRQEIHDMYSSCESEFRHNSQILKELYHLQKNNLINVINGN